MKRVTMLLVAMAGVLALAGGIAVAANISCPNRPDNGCYGTQRGDYIKGTPQADQIRGRGGDDIVDAQSGDGDFSSGGGGKDKVRGEGDSDFVIGGSVTGNFETGDLKFSDTRDDVVKGGNRDDETVAGGYGKGGHDRLYGGEGDDTMYAAQRGFPYRGNVKINRELVNCGSGFDVAYIDRGVDQVKDNCERKINGFPDMDMEESSPGGGFLAGVIGTSE